MPLCVETFPVAGTLKQVNYRLPMTQQTKSKLRDGALISESDLSTRISELAKEISNDYAGIELLAVIVLRGSFMFASDLLRKIDPGVGVRLDFILASSYGAETESSREVQIVRDLEISVAGEHVLIIEDIVETGETLTRVRELIEERGAASVRVATLLQKKGNPKRSFAPNYVGFQIPDVFVVGYGLDFAEYYRKLPDIRILDA